MKYMISQVHGTCAYWQWYEDWTIIFKNGSDIFSRRIDDFSSFIGTFCDVASTSVIGDDVWIMTWKVNNSCIFYAFAYYDDGLWICGIWSGSIRLCGRDTDPYLMKILVFSCSIPTRKDFSAVGFPSFIPVICGESPVIVCDPVWGRKFRFQIVIRPGS